MDLAPPSGVDEAQLITHIERLERLKSAIAAAQADATVMFEASRHAAEEAHGVPAARRGRGVGAEIALARHDSPARGSRHLGFAKALVKEMPHTLAALRSGALSEWRATLIVRESACLDVEDRRRLDAELCADQSELVGLGDARITAAAKQIAYRLDPHAVVDRAASAEKDRTVTVRPAPDCMTYVTALLPVAQGVSVYAALTRQADVCCDGRGRGQVMADVFVERITGRPAAEATPIAVNLVITDDTLLAAGDDPAHLSGYGPIPAPVARKLTADGITDAGKSTLRRLYKHPLSGALIAMESRARRFPKGLAQFIDLRDGTCRTPYCDAPIRHHDHATPHARGGATDGGNGLGACEACNYAKEAFGWQVRTAVDENGSHTAEFTTPTGGRHRSVAPRLPGMHLVDLSEAETRIGVALASHAA